MQRMQEWTLEYCGENHATMCKCWNEISTTYGMRIHNNNGQCYPRSRVGLGFFVVPPLPVFPFPWAGDAGAGSTYSISEESDSSVSVFASSFAARAFFHSLDRSLILSASSWRIVPILWCCQISCLSWIGGFFFSCWLYCQIHTSTSKAKTLRWWTWSTWQDLSWTSGQSAKGIRHNHNSWVAWVPNRPLRMSNYFTHFRCYSREQFYSMYH